MSFEGIVQITTLDDVRSVNEFLDSGNNWELIAITPSESGPQYTLGRRPIKPDPMKDFKLGKHVTG